MVPMNLSAGQKQRCGCREWTRGHRGEGERGMNWETRVEYIHYYVKNRQLVANSPSLFKTHLRCHLNNLTNIKHWFSWHILGMKSLDDAQEELEWFPYRASGHGSPPLLLPLTSSIAYPFSTSASQTLACVQITWESYWKERSRFSRSGVGTKILYCLQDPRRCCWSAAFIWIVRLYIVSL